jgi:CheY-like chemotaxis protein
MRVMLIEDDELVRESIAESLMGDDIDLDGVSNAEDALVLLGAGQLPDVIVTDNRLGNGLSGMQFADIARTRYPEIRIVLISGERLDRPLKKHERFVSKPFDPLHLADVVAECHQRQQACAAGN